MQAAYAMESGIISEIPTSKDGAVDRAALKEQLNSELDTDNGWRLYKKWLNKISDKLITDYDVATNDDILKNMKAQPSSAKTFKLTENGELVVPAIEYSSIADLRKNKGRLAENVAEETKAVADQFLALAKKLGDTKRVVVAINETFRHRYSTSDIIRSFNSKGIEISAEIAGELQGLYRKAVELPTQYFEAKPAGEIKLTRINTAVVPQSISAELRSALNELGIRMIEYNGTKASRVDALNSVEDIKFSDRNTEALVDAGENYRKGSVPGNELVDVDAQFSDRDGFEIRTFSVPRGETVDADKYIVDRHGLVLDDIRQHLPELENMEPVYELDGTEFQNTPDDTRKLKPKVKKYFMDIGGRVWRKELGYVDLNNAGVNDSLSHGYGPLKAASFAALPSVVEKGLMFGPNKYMERGYDTYLFVAPVKFSGSQKGDFYVGAYVIKDANTTRYKIHEVLTVNKKGNRPLKPEADLNGGHLRGDFLSDTRVTQSDLEVKANSDDAQFSDRNPTETSNRSLLANALESAAQTYWEKQKLQEYKDKIQQLEKDEQKLKAAKRQIYEMSFAKGPRDAAYKEKLQKLRRTNSCCVWRP